MIREREERREGERGQIGEIGREGERQGQRCRRRVIASSRQ